MRILLTDVSSPVSFRIFKSILDHDLLPTIDLVISTSSPHDVYSIAKQNDIPILLQPNHSDASVEELAGIFIESEAEIIFLAPLSVGLDYDGSRGQNHNINRLKSSDGNDVSVSDDVWPHCRKAIDAARISGNIKLVVAVEQVGQLGFNPIQQRRMKEYLEHQTRECGMKHLVLEIGMLVENWWFYCGLWRADPTINSDLDLDSNLCRNATIGAERQRITDLDQVLGQNEDEEKKGVKEEAVNVDMVIPCDGPIAWVSLDDVGEGIARILTRLAQGERRWIGQKLNLTGQQTSTIAEVVKMMELHYNRHNGADSGQIPKLEISVRCVGKQDAMKYHLDSGQKEGRFLARWMRCFDAIKDGERTIIDPFLGEVLERELRGTEELIEEDRLFANITGD